MSAELKDKLINVTAKGIKELGLKADYFTTTLPNGTLWIKSMMETIRDEFPTIFNAQWTLEVSYQMAQKVIALLR